MDDLANQLSVLAERNQELEQKSREVEEISVGHENSLRVVTELEKEVAELKCHLSTKSIEIQCMEKKLQDTECIVNDLKLQSRDLDKVVTLNAALLENYEIDLTKCVLYFQLKICEEYNRELQLQLNEKAVELEATLAIQEDAQRLKRDADKEIAELKCQLMAKSIELQYKDKRMEELEKSIDELTLKPLNPNQVFKVCL